MSNQEAVLGLLDSDGDGLADSLDSSPFISDIPVFEGEMFEELKINAVFFNRSENKNKTSELVISSNDENSVIRKSSSYIKSLGDNAASLGAFEQGHIVTKIARDQLDLFTAPIVTDSFADSFMTTNSEYRKEGFILDEVSFEIRNRINIRSERFKNFRDIVFEVLYYDFDLGKLVSIDYFQNKGFFEFNKEHLLDITSITTRNTSILNNSVLKTGRFLVIRIKDYFIPEIDMNYSELIKQVTKKTISIAVTDPEEFKVIHVGTDGKPGQLYQIISKALGSDYEIGQNRLLKYKDFPVGEYRVVDADGSKRSVLSQWYVITNEISNNPFVYSFTQSDFILLKYSRSDDTSFLPTTVSNNYQNTEGGIYRPEAFVPSVTRKIKIILSSLVYQSPEALANAVEKGSCGSKRCISGLVTYAHKSVMTVPRLISSSDTVFKHFTSDIYLVIDGFELSLNDLINQGKLSLKISDEGKFEFESTPQFINQIGLFGKNLVQISLKHKPSFETVAVGEEMTSCRCWSACGGPAVDIGCSSVTDRGQSSFTIHPRNYSFFHSLFIF